MRAMLAVLSLPLLSLAACGGGGDTISLGTIAPPVAGGSGTAGGTGGGAGGGTGGVTPTPTSTPTSFLDVSTTTSFDAVGGLHSIDVTDTGSSLYTGNAGTVAAPSGTITFNPRSGIFTVALADTDAGVSHTVNYQDPAHRTASGNLQAEVPDFPSFN